MRKIFLLLSIYVLLISWGTSQSIKDETKKYFQSESFKKCEDIWGKYRVGYENTLATALKGGYGHQTMNVYVSRKKDALLLSTGFYHSDNQVEILFQDILLEEFPSLLNPEISFDLCGNALSFESVLSKMIIHSDYYLFRNRSDIIYSLKDQDSFKSSPFRFQQVLNTGQIAITAERCTLTGTVFTKLDGSSVNLGVDMLKLINCQFNIDIYTPGQKTPPILANYLFEEGGPNEKNILVQALSKEMMPQLQAALFAHINTSAIFGKHLIYIERQQKVALVKVERYLDNVLQQINKQTIEERMGTVDLENFKINWNDAFDGTEKDCEISLMGMKLSGIDTAYSAHVGGPMKIDGMSIKIVERLRMSNVQVLGVIGLRGIYEGEYNFAADIYDVNIDIKLDVQKLEQKGSDNNELKHEFLVGEWSALEFSCPDIEELPVESIVTGYLIDKLPEHLVVPISKVYRQTLSNSIGDENNDNKHVQPETGENHIEYAAIEERNLNNDVRPNATQGEPSVKLFGDTPEDYTCKGSNCSFGQLLNTDVRPNATQGNPSVKLFGDTPEDYTCKGSNCSFGQLLNTDVRPNATQGNPSVKLFGDTPEDYTCKGSNCSFGRLLNAHVRPNVHQRRPIVKLFGDTPEDYTCKGSNCSFGQK